MAPTPKPSVYGSTVLVAHKEHHLQESKPGPPTHQHYNPEDNSIKDFPYKKNINEPNSPSNVSHGFTSIQQPKEDLTNPDFGFRDVFNVVKSLDVNRYATKKTIAQGMLDIALLTANASQLKYILQVGKQHEFYTLMLTLICTSIALQILSGLLSLSLNLLRDRRMDDSTYAFSVEWIGRARVTLSFIVFLDNIMISAFDPMGLSSLIAYDGPILPGQSPVLQGIICVLLGSTFNINKTQDQPKANVWNNISLAMMVLTVAVNVIISSFDMRYTDSSETQTTTEYPPNNMSTLGIR